MTSIKNNWDGPGPSLLADKVTRNPHDISTWGPECGRGIQYKDLGVQVAGRANVLKISTGRKKKGKA
jgi:hypothetical protein